MSLDANRLGNAIAAVLESLEPVSWPASLTAGEIAGIEAKRNQLAADLADAIIDEVKLATVNPGTFTAGGDAVTGAGTLT